MRPLNRVLAASGALVICGATAVVASAADHTTTAGRPSRTASGRPVTTVLGQGAHRLVVRLTQDAYRGAARYVVTLDGHQQGGELTASAAHGSRGADRLVLLGDWTGRHQLTIRFVNDAYGGDPGHDRNLYVESASYDGRGIAGAAHGMYSQDEQTTISFGTDQRPDPSPTTPVPTRRRPIPGPSPRRRARRARLRPPPPARLLRPRPPVGWRTWGSTSPAAVSGT